MNKKYRAMQVVAPGVLEMTERPVPAPGPDEVLIKIEACGVCGADLRDAEKAPPAGQPGRIPGHEIVGFITRKGNRVPDIWQTGQRVGSGDWGVTVSTVTPAGAGFFISVKTN
jgi:alcohol dehydrogenase